MPLEIVTIPCLSDNYAFLAHDKASGETALIDVPEAGPILEELDRRGWQLTHILLTHHHLDHVQGIDAVLAAYPAKVVGATADAHRLPPLDIGVAEGDTVQIGGESGHVIDVSGHTVGHIAFHFPESQVAFTADSLMALGCGRLFEGTPGQMWQSLQKLAALPPETLICSGHEYTATNARFAQTIEPGNTRLMSRIDRIGEARAKGLPTVPSLLSVELETNPFLRADQPGVRQGVGMEGAAPDEVFAEVRRRKDAF
ncbi:hydroxyacylglutathione hydrolase [Lutimaribacter sp. EGI FJ00015]|uniref:Hydroxyacylglutathione hydrolase n=1 Tax=Lutimaribacter degradans TaxID=2945989 RepID=A0ACC5ZYN2_9RHOB|nr:hydroxyacylglutathione hydrolase [Lutimaribacter sp. EGI FJ00013]MCM2562659.1 hydroxyacylglutathione hydrolase [Lutimaribacter sp. EGI FJ00013]MCO0613816.1 hydroxyacylglutathione hydrolase [Lutimaribacter sp. EGI FJ00015]MCO0636701.1 hydroxyacylglutathione hydrolase [Lutimaribacter sp. EGI FJ00014]